MKEILDFLGSTSNLDTFFTFFIPGFIAVLIADSIGPVQDSDFSKRIGAIVGYSALNFVILGSVVRVVDALNLSTLDPYIKGAFLFVLPLCYPFIIFRLRERQIFGFSTPFPSAWEQFFSRRAYRYFVRAKIKGENRYVLGYYGRNSLASQAPAEQMLLLEKIYDDDGNGNWIERKTTVAFLLPMSECESLEFII
jgi:hypothetical protein